MIDTIQLRFHGILTKKTDTLSEIQSNNTGESIYVVPEHNELYIKMLKYRGRFFNMVKIVNRETTSTSIEDDSEYLHNENNKYQKGINHVKQVMRFVDETEVHEMTMRVTGKIHSPSSLHAVVFNINENGGFIDFNVSIPKYLYEHSLAEFVPQPLSNRYFHMGNPMSINAQRKVLHERLMKFVDRFISDLEALFSLEAKPNLHYVELRRIDLCWNQHFKSKDEALNYLKHQMKFAKGKQTVTNNKLQEYESSLNYFTSSGAYFKIYHKGSEYISSKFGDLKKHQDFNKDYLDRYYRKLKLKHKADELNMDESIFQSIGEKLKNRDYVLNLFDAKIKGNYTGIADEKVRKKANETAKLLKKLQPFKIDFLKDEMDKVLRYEISLRGDYFAYHYKKKVFRKDCPVFKELKENHKFVHSVTHSVKSKKPKLTKGQIKNYKMMDKFFNRSIGLMLSSNSVFKRYLKDSSMIHNSLSDGYDLNHRFYKYTLLGEKDTGIFCNDFLQICLNHFFDTVKNFQCHKLDSVETLSEKIKQYNLRAEKRKANYDSTYHFLTLDIRGNPIIKGNRVIRFASDLLTEKEKVDKGLKKVHPLRIMQVYNELQKGKSLHLIRKDLGLSSSIFSKLKRDLKEFQIYETTVENEIDFNPDISFREYYHKVEGYEYQNKMFRLNKYLNYG